MNTLQPAHIRLWWHTIDRWLLFPLLAIIGLGIWLVFAASPAVAVRINLEKFHFLTRHVIILIPTLLVLFVLSMQSVRTIRVLSFLGFIGALGLTIATLFVGIETKGAMRWLQFPGFSIQPSEFLKPLFAVVIAWVFAKQQEMPRFPSQPLAVGIFAVCLLTLTQQPDMGMSILLTASFFGQYMLAGLPWIFIFLCAGIGILGLLFAYMLLPHFASRIDRFLNPETGDTYQVQKSSEAFANGGWLGTGPGEGTVKMQVPDAHTDFVFAVAGEELGLITCSLIVLLFAAIVLRGFQRAAQQKDMFVLLAVGGIMMQFGFQTLINLGSTLHLIPTKGMTLPFVSYGGSSLVALAIGMGIVLALTRQHMPMTRHSPRGRL
ncbi:MAG: FtsW/RodA/SpoVE family cell cycle protein [Bdellovibrionales bacterium]